MTLRTAVLSTLVALASIGSVLAQTPEPRLTVSGTVVSTGTSSMVVRIDDHGHPIEFLIGTTTLMPAGLEVGSRVTVVYHPIGTAGQMADTVTLLEAAPRAIPLGEGSSGAPSPSTAQAAPPSRGDAAATPRGGQSAGPESEPAPQPGSRLPGTGSPLPVLGLIGLASLLGSTCLRAFERRRP
jgi:hypothetical protein